jgi:hypothetical protein
VAGQPLTVDANGALDGAGNFTSRPVRLTGGRWSIVRYLGSTTGAGAVWTILQQNRMVDTGQGGRFSGNQLLVSPLDTLIVQVQQGTTFQPVVGAFIGASYDTQEEALDHFHPSPTPQGIAVTGAISIVGGQGNFSDIIVTGEAGAAVQTHWVGGSSGAAWGAPGWSTPVAGDWQPDTLDGFRIYNGTNILLAVAESAPLNGGPPGGSGRFNGDRVYDYKYGIQWVWNGSSWLPSAPLSPFDSQSPTGASMTIPASGSILSGFRSLRIKVKARTTSGNVLDNLLMQFNGDTGAHYDYQQSDASGASAFIANAASQTSFGVSVLNGGTSGATLFTTGFIEVIGINDTTGRKAYVAMFWENDGATTRLFTSGGAWQTSNAALTSITLAPSAGNFGAGSLVVTELYQ